MWVSFLIAVLALVFAAWLMAQVNRMAVIVYEWEHALLYVDGRFERQLPAGRHRVWPKGKRRRIEKVSAREQVLNSAQVDVLTADRYALRLSASVTYRIIDPRAVVENPPYERLYRAVNEALLTIAIGKSLDALVTERAALGEPLAALIAPKLPELELSATISAVTLPPEVRRMMTELERARMEGQVALERARGEQAALRSLANAARLLKGNPELMALRTLQAASPTGKGATLVLGQGALTLPASEG